jgi:hypothetical protein
MSSHDDTRARVTVLNEQLIWRGERDAARLTGTIGSAAFFLSVGLLYGIYVFGLPAIDPTNVSILPSDSATSYMGWLFFRHEEHLSLPLGWSSALGYPRGEPIAYLDSLPLVATLFWPFRHWLPEHFQYLGLWWILCSTLSFYFGSRICRRLCDGDWVAGIAGGLLFMAAPIFLYRAQQHFALASHWLILAALEFYLSCSARLSWRNIAASVVIVAIAGGINPYIALMSQMLIGAGYMRSVLTKSERAQRPQTLRVLVAVTGMGSAVAAMLLSWLLFGFLRPGDLGAYAGDGYGRASMNLLAPIDPMHFPALLLRQQPNTNLWQTDGYNYFGLGILLLGSVVFVRQPRMVMIHLLQRDARPGWLVFVICMLLALSLKATIGPFVIYDLHVPSPVLQVLSAFRASGRLFWPAFYLALSGIVSTAFAVFGKRAAFAMLCAFAIQAADLHGLRNDIRHQWSSNPVALLTGVSENMFTDGPVWQQAAHRYRHLVVLPAWQCAMLESPGGELGFWTFGKLAGEHQMTINSFYAGRTSPTQLDYFCNQMPLDLRKGGLAEDSAYVFGSAAQAYSIRRNGHACRALDGVILCVKASDAQSFGQDMSVDLAQLPMDASVSMSLSNPTSDRLFGPGWLYPESWGRWTLGREASLSFRAQGTGALRVDLISTALASATHPQNIQIFANDRHVKDWLFVDGFESKISFDLPAELIGPERAVSLKFVLPDAISPAQLGIGDDSRELGIGLKSIYLNPE